MGFKVTNVELEFGKQSKVVRGVKGGKVPPNAVYGGNGSFRTQEKPRILISTSDGRTTNYYYPIKAQTSKPHVTRKYAAKVCNPLIGREFDNDRELAQAIYDNL